MPVGAKLPIRKWQRFVISAEFMRNPALTVAAQPVEGRLFENETQGELAV